LDNSYDYSITRISINPEVIIKEPSTKPTAGSTQSTSEDKAKEKTVSLKQWTSKFYCATEEGDVIYSDWISAEKSGEDKGSIMLTSVSRVENVFSYHYGPVNDLQRSPFFPDILLSAGGWSFHIWKEKTNTGPILSGAMSSAYITCCEWSPTRPGVFCVGRSDGVVEVWDLLDKSHVPSTTQSVTSTAISYIKFQQHLGRSGIQFIAVGDDDGTLHILETPRNLKKPSKNEVSTFEIRNLL
jgi:dynein intermediate chain 3, axonemal